MFSFAALRQVHLELTTACNAACPQCPRNLEGDRANPHVPHAALGLADVQAILPPAVLRQLEGVLLCGNYGDPMLARDLLAIVAYLRAAKPTLTLRMNTNGSGRDETFWRALAGHDVACTFGIDGLGDTHARYRRGTDWNRVIEHAQAFIAAGGRATWDFLVFRHNAHQVETARALSAALGFRRFVVKRTSRFWQHGQLEEATVVRGRDGAVVDRLELPEAARHRNDAFAALQALARAKEHTAGYRHYLDHTPIGCRALHERQVYIDASGMVLPCCYVGALYDGVPRAQHPVWRRIDALPGGATSLDARRTPLAAIVDGPLFAQMGSAWEPAGPARLAVCARVCGHVDLRDGMVAAPRTPGSVA